MSTSTACGQAFRVPSSDSASWRYWFSTLYAVRTSRAFSAARRYVLMNFTVSTSTSRSDAASAASPT